MAKRWQKESTDSTQGQQADAPGAAAYLTSSIVEHFPDMIFVKEANELRFVQFNRAAEILLGRPREELLGKNDFDLFPENEANAYVEKDREVLREGKMHEVAEEPLHTAAGLRILRTKKVPIFDKDGRPTHLLGISEDITELRAVQSDLHATRDDLVAARFREAEKAQLLAATHAPIPEGLASLLTELQRNAEFLTHVVQSDLSPQHSELVKQLLQTANRAAQYVAPTALPLPLPSNPQTTPGEPFAETEPLELDGVRVLFADDEAPMRQVAQIVLSRAGAEVTLAENGQIACEQFRQNPGSFDIILLDLSMPIMGGQEALRILRGMDSTMPVLISTGHDGAPKVTGLTGVGYLQKPYRARTLTDAILEMLKNPETTVPVQG